MRTSNSLSNLLNQLQARAGRPLVNSVVALTVVSGAFLGAATRADDQAPSDDIAPSVSAKAAGEKSVLIETRKVAEDAVSVDGDQTLQPISTISDQQPRLADPEPVLAKPRAKDDAVKLAAKVPVAPPMPSDAESTEDSVVEDTEVADEATSTPQPSSFHGVQPGVTTKQQLLDAWGPPDEVAPTDAGQLLTFNLESFRGVEVLVEDNTVTLMKINLRTPAEPATLAAKVKADQNEAVEITDEATGQIAAYAYPERGIVMVIDAEDAITPKTKSFVSQMLLQPLDSQTFCLRAERRPDSELSGRVADLQRAAELAPRDAHPHWLLAEVLLEAGRVVEAEQAASLAVDLEPESIAYRQRWGASLAAIGNYDDAVLETREVLDDDQAPTLVRARALHQMGLLASLGEASIADKVIGFHNMAIAEADKLATSDNGQQRRAAKRLLVESHLAIAEEISRRDYEDKLDNVAQWVSRASAFAEELIENDGGDLGLRIRVAQQSLNALSNFKPAGDPDPLIQEINETLEEIKKDAPDPLWMDQLEWTTGIAYLSAMQIEHHRRHPKKALTYSERAIELLADKAESRRDNPAIERLIGKLYFHIGAVHAVHQTKHGEAVIWYDRAFPLLTNKGPNSELVVPRHEGEALVSMAVSYWEQNDKKRAISLTEMGADLIEQAVNGGVMDKANLGVPYGNLAVMHKKLGDTTESQRYARLAQSLKESKNEADTKQAQADEGRKTPAKPTALKPSRGSAGGEARSKTASRPGESSSASASRSKNRSKPQAPRRGARGRTILR